MRRQLRILGAAVWCLVTLSVAVFALLKPSPSAAELGFVPTTWALWLDDNYDLRTLLMTLAITLPPAALLIGRKWRLCRVYGLIAVTSLLVACEFAQLGIYSRGFGWADVGYTFLGALMSEALVRLSEWMRRS